MIKRNGLQGFIVSYNAQTHGHEIVYDEEEEHYIFDLSEDIFQGDLIVTSD